MTSRRVASSPRLALKDCVPGTTLELSVAEDGEELYIPLFATAAITAGGAGCSFASALAVAQRAGRNDFGPVGARRPGMRGWQAGVRKDGATVMSDALAD